ncbi:MAG: murein biosynthesis integral membrane protein MurJ [Actinobacteria bacterium]|nr:MAG: murein biosynthesis integral membrane protein MurJ [Actinomycetota bacterium]
MSERDAANFIPKAKLGKKSFAQNTLLMSALTSISRVTGFLKFTALSTVLGTIGTSQLILDSYNLANIIPNYIYELVLGGILSSIIIPIFIEYMAKKGEKEAFKIASIIVNLAFIILGSIALLGTLAPYYFVKIQTAMSGSQDIERAIFFFRFFAIQILFYGLGAIATGILHSYRRFGVPTFAPILNNLAVIITVVFFYGPNIKNNPIFALTALAVGTTAGVFLLFLVQIPSLFKIGFKYVPSLNIRHPAIIQSAKMAWPLLFYVMGNIVPMFVEMNLGWQFSNGVTSLQFAWPFFQLPFGIFAVSVVNALFPALSENIAKGNIKEFKKQISLGLRTIGFIIWPASIGLIVLSKPITSLAYRHGGFSQQAAIQVAEVLSFFALGLFFFAGFYFLLRAFYARQDTITPAIISIISMIFNIVFDLLIIDVLSVKGLALGRSLAYFISFALIWFMLRKKVGPMEKRVIISNTKFFIAAVFMGLVAFFSLKLIDPFFLGKSLFDRLLLFGIPAALSVSIYFSSIVVFKSPEVNLVRDLLKRQKR